MKPQKRPGLACGTRLCPMTSPSNPAQRTLRILTKAEIQGYTCRWGMGVPRLDLGLSFFLSAGSPNLSQSNVCPRRIFRVMRYLFLGTESTTKETLGKKVPFSCHCHQSACTLTPSPAMKTHTALLWECGCPKVPSGSSLAVPPPPYR